MIVTRTINYGWNTLTRAYSTTCPACGKPTRRIASRGFNSLATSDDRARYRAELTAEAERLSRKPVTCNKCLKAKLVAALPVELIDEAVKAEIGAIEADDAKLAERKRAVVDAVGAHRGRLFLHQGETYAQWGCGFGYWNSDGFTVSGNRVSKVRPWETTDDQVHARLEEVTYLDDTLEVRKAAVNGRA